MNNPYYVGKQFKNGEPGKIEFYVSGPSIGPDIAINPNGSVKFGSREEAVKAVEIANAAYRAGVFNTQRKIRESLGISDKYPV